MKFSAFNEVIYLFNFIIIILFWPLVDVFLKEFTIRKKHGYNTQFVQSAAGKDSCSRMGLKRTNTETCWNRKLISLISLVLKEILLPISFKRRRAEELKTSLLLFIIIVIRIRNNNHRCHVTCEAQYSHGQQTW